MTLLGDWNWYLIGPNQWIEQRNVALVQPGPPGGAAGTVIAVDTYEQSLGVYVNGGLIYATLVSSGSSESSAASAVGESTRMMPPAISWAERPGIMVTTPTRGLWM